MRDSVYMNLNPEEYKTAYVYYMIETDGSTDAWDVAWNYQMRLNSDESLSTLGEKTIPGKEEQNRLCCNLFFQKIWMKTKQLRL